MKQSDKLSLYIVLYFMKIVVGKYKKNESKLGVK